MEAFNTDFGVQSTEVIEGTPHLFSDPDTITKVEEPKEEVVTEPAFDLNTNDGPKIFDNIAPQKKEELKEETKAPEVKEVVEESDTVENPYSVYYKTLVDQGIFSEVEGEEEISTPEQFLEKWQSEITNKVNSGIYSYFTRFGQDKLDFLTAVFEEGIDPKEYFQVSQKIESVKALNLESAENQEFVITQYYKSLGWNNQKISKHLKRLEDDGETEEEAKEAHGALLQREEAELQSLRYQQQMELQRKEEEKNYYNNNIRGLIGSKLKEKDFDGLPVTDKVAAFANDFLTTEKWQLPTGEKLTDFDKWVMDLKRPENYEIRLKLALLKENNFDFSKVKNKAITEKTNKLFDGLTRQEKQTNRSSQPINTGFSI